MVTSGSSHPASGRLGPLTWDRAMAKPPGNASSWAHHADVWVLRNGWPRDRLGSRAHGRQVHCHHNPQRGALQLVLRREDRPRGEMLALVYTGAGGETRVPSPVAGRVAPTQSAAAAPPRRCVARRRCQTIATSRAEASGAGARLCPVGGATRPTPRPNVKGSRPPKSATGPRWAQCTGGGRSDGSRADQTLGQLSPRRYARGPLGVGYRAEGQSDLRR